MKKPGKQKAASGAAANPRHDPKSESGSRVPEPVVASSSRAVIKAPRPEPRDVDDLGSQQSRRARPDGDEMEAGWAEMAFMDQAAMDETVQDENLLAENSRHKLSGEIWDGYASTGDDAYEQNDES
jgi:hypothetical protein